MTLAQQPLLIGAWIGLIHAFDADHISTLGSLALGDRRRTAYGYAARWACGHAVAIGTLGALALGIGMLWIAGVSRVAEIAVALLLIGLGANAVVPARLRRVAAPDDNGHGHGHGHRHGHRHGHGHASANANAKGLGMGLLHGGAGSAAVLALLPLAGFDSALAAAGFLMSFSLGVAAGALLFAAVFAGVFARTVASGERVAAAFAVTVGAIAAGVGVMMLLGALDGG